MKRILVFQHVAYELLGSLHPLLKSSGFRIRYANFDREPDTHIHVNHYDGLVILGGPMGAYEGEKYPHLVREIEAIRQAIAEQKPVLGICLGAQLIAAALGAPVARHPEREIGWHEVTLTPEGKSDPILGELDETERIFQWHGDSFALPNGAVWLARSKKCPHQAFRYGTNVYGFQFHLEVDEPLIDRWLKVPQHQPELESLGGPTFLEKIRHETKEHLPRQLKLGHKVFSKYIALFSTKRRTTVLGSGHK